MAFISVRLRTAKVTHRTPHEYQIRGNCLVEKIKVWPWARPQTFLLANCDLYLLDYRSPTPQFLLAMIMSPGSSQSPISSIYLWFFQSVLTASAFLGDPTTTVQVKFERFIFSLQPISKFWIVKLIVFDFSSQILPRAIIYFKPGKLARENFKTNNTSKKKNRNATKRPSTGSPNSM